MRSQLAILGLLLFVFSCKKREVVFDNDHNDNFSEVFILEFNHQNCFYDKERKELKFSISEDSLVSFNPLVRFQQGAELTLDGKELERDKRNLLEHIELFKHYPLTIEIHDEEVILDLVFTTSPLLRLTTHDEIKNEPRIVSRMEINHPDNHLDANTMIGVEIRGFSSASYSKKSYGVTPLLGNRLNEVASESFFNYPANDAWILDAMFMDPSFSRNKCSFDLWSEIAPYSLQSTFVEVYINNKAVGVYRFSENLNRSAWQVDQKSLLVKSADNDPYTFFEEVSTENPNSAFWGSWEQIIPNPNTNIILTDFVALCNLIVKSDSTSFVNGIDDVLDLDNMIDYYLFANLTYAVDNFGKNILFYKKSANDKFVIIPWDLDATWGVNPFNQFTPFDEIEGNNLFDRLLKLNPANFRTRLKNRWTSLRATVYNQQSLVYRFSKNFDLIEAQKYQDIENDIWTKYIDLNSEKFYLLSWLNNRVNYLDTYIISL